MDKLSRLLINSAEYNDQVAFTTNDGNKSTYAEMCQSWRALETFIISRGFASQSRIGILLPTKDRYLVSIGAILLSNNVYVPLDYNAPIIRNLHTIRDNCLQGLFISSSIYEQNKSEFPDHEVKLIESQDFIFLTLMTESKVVDIPIDLAYMLNTSGSTGKPKGVMVRHENALSFISWASSAFAFSKQDKFTSIAPFHFDLSIFDLYVAIKHGASILFFESNDIKNPMLLAKKISDEKITVMYATPTILMLLLRYGKLHKYDYSSLRYVFFAGEVFPIEQLKQLKTVWSHVQFCNWYGPTETNVCTYFEIPDVIDEQDVPFPIGKDCLPSTTQIAEDGELLVSGGLVTPGYWNNPQKNQTAFISDSSNVVWYKTGDIVSVDSSGNYIFKGRKDRMIKRRGYRIELDELEHHLQNHSAVQVAAVISTIDKKGNLIIVCYYTTTSVTTTLSSADFRDYLLETVPIYMLPDKYVAIDELPKTSTQKIDYVFLTNSYNRDGTN